MRVILNTQNEYDSFVESMTKCTHVEYDLDEYASVVIQKLDELLTTTAANDGHIVVQEVTRAYSLHRPLEDQKIFESVCQPLFQTAVDQLMLIKNVHEAHLSFVEWVGGSMVIEATLDT